ncbi:MAG: aminotransferase class V-fold PLP-dependent enzyme [Candidatus Magasanikbacteria bacterium]|nr:aminotransferase class V-fold PLP-dependent enzyme [Candidatus Magasanikbacteria bacterium]
MIGLGAAVKFIQEIGWSEIQSHEQSLTNKLINELTNVGAQIVGSNTCHSESPVVGGEESPAHSTDGQRSLVGASLTRDDNGKVALPNRIGVVSFTLPGIHPHDVAEILNQNNVAVRAGHQCAMPLHKHLGLSATVRVSLGMYTTKEDADALIAAIEKTKKVFK